MLWKMIFYFSKGLFSDHTSGPQEVAAVLNFSTKKSLSSFFVCQNVSHVVPRCWYVYVYRVSQKTHFQSAAGARVHWLNHHMPAPLVSGDWFFGNFLLRLSRIKRPQVMLTVKFNPIALNFGNDFVLLVCFLLPIGDHSKTMVLFAWVPLILLK